MSETTATHAEEADFLVCFFPVQMPGVPQVGEGWRLEENLALAQCNAFLEPQFAAHAVQCNCACK